MSSIRSFAAAAENKHETVEGRAFGLGWTRIFASLLAIAIVSWWIIPLRSSFWIDESITHFVVVHGGSHPSLSAAPQITASIYYVLPWVMERMFGFSEVAYRVPSVLLMGITLLFLYRIAVRLIHPEAGWFMVFACLALRGFNYQASDARPYPLATCLFAATLLCLIRWLDSGARRDSLLFVLCAALFWRAHLVVWPCYLVLAFYAAVRLVRKETPVRVREAVAITSAVALLVAPVALQALRIANEAPAHAIASLPGGRDLASSLKFGLVTSCAVAAFALSRMGWLLRVPRGTLLPMDAAMHSERSLRPSTLALAVAWWVIHPLTLFAFSTITGSSIFLQRYLSVSVAGIAFASTAVAAQFLSVRQWKFATLILAIAVLLNRPAWREPWPRHDNSNWRAAAQAIVALDPAGSAPVLCPSPIVEARPPIWGPRYQRPSVLYPHLETYPSSQTYLLPFEDSPEAEDYARMLSRVTLPARERFFVYGGDRNVKFWREWFAQQPPLRGWHSRRLGGFGDVEVVVFERPQLWSRH